MATTKIIERRKFLQQSIAAGCGMVTFPYLIPSVVIGQNPPSNKIVMGAIGVGAMGLGDLEGFLNKDQVHVVVVCDVDMRHVDRAKELVNKYYKNNDCMGYTDYRELIERHDLDAVMHALPDHWHGIVSVDCARRGLDIHGQKPLARTIQEGRAICDAVKRYGRIWQTGSWQRSVLQFRQAAELVINGRIGRVKYVEVGLPNGGTSRLFSPCPAPKSLDYDMWLGPAPWREYSPFSDDGSVHWHWRWIMDYSGGQLTDWAGHHVDIAHWGLGLDKSGPVEIEGRGQYPAAGTYNVPYAYKFRTKYENGVEMVVANCDQQPKGQGVCWYGEEGKWIFVDRKKLEASSEKILKEKIHPDEIQLYKSSDHLQNFIDCVRNRRETITPAEIAHRSISVGLLGEIAMLTQRKLFWDPEKEQFKNDDQANKLLSRPFRKPWQIYT